MSFERRARMNISLPGLCDLREEFTLQFHRQQVTREQAAYSGFSMSGSSTRVGRGEKLCSQSEQPIWLRRRRPARNQQ
jgi:hypothetical protein